MSRLKTALMHPLFLWLHNEAASVEVIKYNVVQDTVRKSLSPEELHPLQGVLDGQ